MKKISYVSTGNGSAISPYEAPVYKAGFTVETVYNAKKNIILIEKHLPFPRTLDELYHAINPNKRQLGMLRSDLKEILKCLKWARYIGRTRINGKTKYYFLDEEQRKTL